MFLQETYKMFTRPYAFFAMLVVIILTLLFGFSFAMEGNEYYTSFFNTFNKGVEFEGNLINGNLFAYQLFHALWLFIPFLVVFVTGGMISEEKKEGTLRLVLSKPISKTAFFTARFIAAKLFVFLLVLLMAVLGLGLGLAIFGSGELLAFENGKFIVLSSDEALIRFAAAYGYYFLVLITVASLSMFFSVLYNNSVKAIMASASVILMLYFISSLEIPFFESAKPFLLTTYFSSWSQLFVENINWMNLMFDVIVLVVHILVFYVLAVTIFNKKEIYE